MNVFELRDRLVADYSDFTRSFLQIHDKRIRARGSKQRSKKSISLRWARKHKR